MTLCMNQIFGCYAHIEMLFVLALVHGMTNVVSTICTYGLQWTTAAGTPVKRITYDTSVLLTPRFSHEIDALCALPRGFEYKISLRDDAIHCEQVRPLPLALAHRFVEVGPTAWPSPDAWRADALRAV